MSNLRTSSKGAAATSTLILQKKSLSEKKLHKIGKKAAELAHMLLLLLPLNSIGSHLLERPLVPSDLNKKANGC